MAHGGRVHRAAATLRCRPADLLDLSASLNPVAPSVIGFARDVLSDIAHYPDHDAAADRMATAIGIDPDRLVLTNGAAEAIALVAGLHPVGDVVDPEFSLYRRHLASVVVGAPRWRSDPVNPTGELAGPDERAAVWDESFYPLATGRWSRGDVVDDDGRTSWRIGSLTKLWACPGLRLGYVIAPDASAAAAIRAAQPEWSVNAVAVGIVAPMLERTDLPAWQAAVAGLRDDLVELLTVHGWAISAGAANWVLVHDVHPDTIDGLFRRRVLVRDCADFGLPGTVRVAVPDDQGRRRLAAALAAIAPPGAWLP